MGYVALKAMDVGGTERRPGDPVPEAAAWPHLNRWVKRGFVAYVIDGTEQKFRDELRQGRLPQHLSPTTLPHHLSSAARHVNYGAPSAETSLTSPTEVADGAPPTETDEASSSPETPKVHPAIASTTKPNASPNHASANRKRG